MNQVCKKGLTITLVLISALLSGCDNGGASTNSDISSTMASSSSQPRINVSVEPIFPTNFANLGGINSAFFTVKLESTSFDISATSYNLEGTNLTQVNNGLNSNIWVTIEPILLDISNEVIELQVRTEDGDEIGNPISFYNSTIAIAGETPAIFDSGSIAVSENNLYVVDANLAAIYSIDLSKGSYNQIYINMDLIPDGAASNKNWPLVIDRSSNELIFIEQNAEQKNLRSINLETGSLVNYATELQELNEAKYLFMDINGSHLLSFGGRALYIVDSLSSQLLFNFRFDEPTEKFSSIPISPNATANFSDDIQWLGGYLYDSNNIHFIRASTFNISSANIELTSTENGAFGIQSTARLRNEFMSNEFNINNPTAFTYDSDGTLYLAESNKLWAVSLTDNNITLISSSSTVPQTLGQGPSFGSDLTSMVVHPETGIIFLAAGSRGLFAINPETGNRILVSN